MTKNKNLRKKLGAGALAAGIITLTTLRAGAAAIPLQNPSFENTVGNTPADWTGNFQNILYSSQYLSTSVGTGASGTVLLALNPQYGGNGTIAYSEQTSTQDITALNTDDTITLNVALGEFDYFGTTFGVTSSDFYGTVDLLIGGKVVETNDASDTPTLTAGGFSELTMSYTVLPTDSGDVGVEFITPAYNTTESNVSVDRYYDNVSLDISGPSITAPEPSTWAMLVGGIGLLALRLRKRLLS